MPSAETFEFKAITGQIDVDEAKGIVECFVAGIGNKDSVGDIVLPGAFTESLKRRKPRVVWGHDWNHPIGKVLDIYEVGPNDPRLPMKMRKAGIGGLFARVQFNLKSEKGREAFTNVSFFGEEQEWSIGYKTLDAFFDGARKANMLKEVELYEVSPVLHGANQLTATISIKSEDQEKGANGPCWDGYQQVGMKKGKNGEMVPNCVPINPEGKADQPLKDPKGGLTAAGREYFKRTEGANLKPGVRGRADTPEKMRRKGSFLTRFFTNPSGPMKDEKGRPTRLALSAAAWGEPVPQDRSDAAALAAKGRRLLERYEKVKKKGHWAEKPNDDLYDSDDDYVGPRGEDGGVPAMNPAIGRMGNLARALSMRFGGNVRLRLAQENLVVFDHVKDGESMIMRVTYHYDGDEFMFGEPEKVRTETVYLPADEEREEEGAGQIYREDDDDDDDRQFDDTDEKFMEMLRMVAKRMREGRMDTESDMKSLTTDIEVKAGRVLNRSNIGKLQQAISLLQEVMATGGAVDIEMKKKMDLYIPVEVEDLFEMKSMIDELCDFHGLEAKALHDGIIISGEFSDDAEEDVLIAMEDYAVKVRPERFDPNAVDADMDGVVQEGTPFKRPAPPRVNKLTESAERIHRMVDAMGHVLDEDERKILRFRATRTLDDAAKKFGMPREKIRQREAIAMAKIRDATLTTKPRGSADKIQRLVSDYGDVLTPDEREILKFRSENTLEEAAKKFGGTRESIRQKEAKALAKIRAAFDAMDDGDTPKGKPLASQTTVSGGIKPPNPRVERSLSKVRALQSDKFDAEREFGDFNRRFQKHTVDGSMGKSDIVSMNRMYENLTKKAKREGIDPSMFTRMSSDDLEEFFQAIAFGKMEPDTRAEFLAMLMADFELGMRKISKHRAKNGPQGAFEPKIEVDKILKDMASRMDM